MTFISADENTMWKALTQREGSLCSALLEEPVYTNTGGAQKILENPYKNKLWNAQIPTDRYYV